MSDYWDHPEYGKLEEKLKQQVATTRKWMALHDEAVDALEQAQADLALCNDLHKTISSQLDRIEQLEAAIGNAIRHLDDVDGASLVAYDLENVIAGDKKPIIGENIKVHLPGESPWAEIIEEREDAVKGRIVNKLLHEYSEHEQAQFMKREFDDVQPLEKLHDYKQGDELWFELGQHGEWVPLTVLNKIDG